MIRVNKNNLCPICGRSDWCGLSDDGNLVICMRVPEGSIGTARNGGYIHILKERDLPERRSRTVTVEIKPKQANPEYRRLNDLLRNAVKESQLDALAKQLGLSAVSLHRLQIGWCNCLKVWLFPMFAPDGQIRGFRLRGPSGKKFSMTGGREGLFIPRNLQFDQRRLLICEGPTDAAACLDLGFDAIGRPSCLGAVELTAAFVRERWPLDVVIVADADRPGQEGASRLADVLTGMARTVQIIEPPAGVKDIREWRRQGATRENVLNLIQQTEPIKILIQGEIVK